MLVGMKIGPASVEISVDAESRVRQDGGPCLSRQLRRPKQEDQGYIVSHGVGWATGWDYLKYQIPP